MGRGFLMFRARPDERTASESRPTFAVLFRQPMDSAKTNTVAAAAQKAATTEPLILAAALVWLSVDLIGDGLLALRTLLASVISERTTTPS
jgi:hypothetical protein